MKDFSGVERLNHFSYKPEFRQFRRRNNDLYAACYALYRTGKSLEHIARAHYHGRFTRQSLYDVFRVRGYKLRDKQLRPARAYKGKVFRQDKYGGYRSRAGGEEVYLHRLLWEEHHGKIPPDFVVVFRDGDRENIVIENLDCLHREEAKKRYNHGNQFGYKRFVGKGIFGAAPSQNNHPAK